MWSYCLLDLGADFLVGNMVFGKAIKEELPVSPRFCLLKSLVRLTLSPPFLVLAFFPDQSFSTTGVRNGLFEFMPHTLCFKYSTNRWIEISWVTQSSREFLTEVNGNAEDEAST